MKMLLIPCAASALLLGCGALYVPHNGSVPHGYQERWLAKQRVEVNYESYKRISEERACELALQRLAEVASGQPFTVIYEKKDTREEVVTVSEVQGMVNKPTGEGRAGPVIGVLAPAHDIVHRVKRCRLTAELEASPG